MVRISRVGTLESRWNKLGGVCELTGWALDEDNFNIDHKTPISRGGDDSVDNLQFLHPDVNRAKGTMTNDEFIGMCVEVAIANGSGHLVGKGRG